MTQDTKDNFGNLNPEQRHAVEAAIKKLKAKGSERLHELEHGGSVADFPVPEKPGSLKEVNDEKLMLDLRHLGSPHESKKKMKKDIEQANVHVSKEGDNNIKIEIETPFGFLQSPAQRDSITRNFLVVHVDDTGKVLDTPKVDTRDLNASDKKR